VYRRDGSLAVHLNRQSQGWRIVHPRITPEVIEPDLDAAKARARSIALAALPLHPATRRHYAEANQLPSGTRLLSLQDMSPEQRKIAPLDVARFAVPRNLLGGARFPDAPRLDAETRKAILAAELDPPRITSAISGSIEPAKRPEPRAVDVRIVQDETYPNMYRIVYPDGFSDMISYARAIDACSDLAETAPPQAAPVAAELVSVSGAGEPLPLEDGIPDFLRRFRFDRAAE
jgi:hypothetical protein